MLIVIGRDEIAGCSEKAYDSLSLNDARQMLLFSSDKELHEYIKEVKFLALCFSYCTTLTLLNLSIQPKYHFSGDYMGLSRIVPLILGSKFGLFILMLFDKRSFTSIVIFGNCRSTLSGRSRTVTCFSKELRNLFHARRFHPCSWSTRHSVMRGSWSGLCDGIIWGICRPINICCSFHFYSFPFWLLQLCFLKYQDEDYKKSTSDEVNFL